MRIRHDVLDAIVAHARRESPRECCGLLIGEGERIVEAVPVTNVAADPARRYEISPADYFTQIKRCRALTAEGKGTTAVVGAYHSHPHSAPEPSPTDTREAFEGFVYVIIGPVNDPDREHARAYRLEGGNLQPLPLVPEAQGADP